MSVNKNNLSDIADYHEKIKFFLNNYLIWIIIQQKCW